MSQESIRAISALIKKGHAVDSALNGAVSFQMIFQLTTLSLKTKRLLSLKNLPFIFSHSALREGWDNPDVFSDLYTENSDSTTAKRQEVGRGLRLCVNQDGNRMDAESCGDSVQKINVLTVIASDSYKDFVGGLQTEIKSVLYDRRRRLPAIIL